MVEPCGNSVWGTGQDQMRIVKQKLLEMMPGAAVFLDVDDLTEGRGMEFVDRSETVLIFVSKGYFASERARRARCTCMLHGGPR